jgi:2-isopropylmalate synthase
VIRVNSQSGKGGVAYIMKAEHHMDLPRRLQIEFSGVIQSVTDGEGGEIEPTRMGELFRAEYFDRTVPLALNSVHTSSAAGGRDALEVGVYLRGEHRVLNGSGNGPIDAFVNALGSVGYEVRVLDYAEHAMSSGTDASAAAYVECAIGGEVYWGVGIDSNIVTASLKAVVSAVNRAV